MNRSGQRGQVIVLFAAMLVVLVGVVSLVVDLGQMYVVRRNLQNSADEAALVGSSKLPDVGAARTAAQASAQANTPAGTSVQVNIPPSSGPYSGAGYSDGAIEVILSQNVTHLYAVLLGNSSSTVRASAVAVLRPYGGGPMAITGLKEDDSKTVGMGGSSDAQVNGDVWSNSGVYSGGTSDLTVSGTIFAVDGLSGDTTNITASDIQYPSWPIKDPLRFTPTPPKPSGCDPDPKKWDNDIPKYKGSGWQVVSPGCYKSITVGSSTRYMFVKGVYYVSGDVKLQGDLVGVASTGENADEAFALSEPSSAHPWGGVCFYLTDTKASFSINSQARVKLAATDEYWKRILIWMVDGSGPSGGVKLNGGGDTRLMGTIYAPKTDVSLAGNYTYGGTNLPLLEGAVVANTVGLGGTSDVVVSYNSDYAAEWPYIGVLVR